MKIFTKSLTTNRKSANHWLFIILPLLLCFALKSYSQNDNCANAIPINLPPGGFGLGTFNSGSYSITTATTEPGESFAAPILSGGLTDKSIWFKFTLPTTRKVAVILGQPSTAITAGDVGFAVYKTSNCLPSTAEIYSKFTPIADFGSSSHPCVEKGDYLVQVSGRNSANGQVYIQLIISDTTGAVYDHPVDAFDFGTLVGHSNTLDFPVECQSTENAAEVCTVLSNYQDYSKSTWHTFTTPAYFDFVTIMLSSPTCSFPNGQNVFGYNLYQGDSHILPIGSLTPLATCDSFKTDGYTPDYKLYRCNQLQPNTTYSIQVFYNKDFNADVRLAVNYEGIAPTQAPQAILSGVPASNQLGVLPTSGGGVVTTATDYYGCNSRHIIHPCNPALPGAGINDFGIMYNLSTFYTFQLSTSTTLDLNAYTNTCGYPLLLRLFNQNLTNTCSNLNPATSLVADFQGSKRITCLPAGSYTLQISGSDSLRNDLYCGSGSACLLTNFGQQITLYLTATTLNAANQFSLTSTGAYDPINFSAGAMQPLQNGINYTSVADTFGCLNTVMPVIPVGSNCLANPDKAMYREFVIGDADGNGIADSGIVSLNYYGYYGGGNLNYMLFKGNANSLSTAQNAHNYPQTITGLVPYTECRIQSSCFDNVCVTPGTYTLVTMGDDNSVGIGDNMPTVQFNIRNTMHLSGPTAQNMGNIIDTINLYSTNNISTDLDYFSCKDNATTINGYPPPIISSGPATKAIYREFYLNAPAIVTICELYNGCLNGGYFSLFAGQASAGLNSLVVQQFNGQTVFTSCLYTAACSPLPSGWYTLVSYGSGPTYQNPLQTLNEFYYGSYVGIANQINIAITLSCPGPQFNRPYKASVDNATSAPYLLQWAPRAGSTAAYPIMDTTYTLNTENFNCTIDIPFNTHPIVACEPTMNRVAYYVFKLTQESYIQINTQGLWGEVFARDVRVDSLLFPATTPVQPCLQSYGFIQLCRLQPGTYTLVIFASDANVSSGCSSVTPTIYIDNVGYSRFDHANKAYDFGLIPPDSLYYNGNPLNLVNPLNPLRAASNDFFYCTTGSQQSDPTEAACGVLYNPEIYNPGVNNDLYNASNLPDNYNVSRRNLWYSFVIDKPGNVHVKVSNMTPDKPYQYPFAIYKSDVNGLTPFATVVSTGQVDSTLGQGLQYIRNNLYSYYCTGADEVSFYRDPCLATTADRYYVVVDNRNSFGYNDYNAMQPNSQVEVSIMLDSVNSIAPLFDHYYQASNMGNVGAGTFIGATDNFSCATADVTDPSYAYYGCGQKTLWYKFTTNVTGHVRYRVHINGAAITGYDYTFLQLFRQTIPGDSTTNGLYNLTNASNYYYDPSGYPWNQTCVSAGTYYIMITGCNQLNEYEYPEIEIIEDAGDFCSAPVVLPVVGPGNYTANAIVDCHTIGTDYGEFAPTLSCPNGANTLDYKSTWFRVDIPLPDTVDIVTNLSENTIALSNQIKYRLMTGNCSAMQEQGCVEDAGTINSYKCLIPGSYFIQVFTPLYVGGQQVTGDVDLHISVSPHADSCAPIPTCLSTASFVPQFDCNANDSAIFINYSTYGSAITYNWNFGYAGQTSAAVSPRFQYPVLATTQTYTVTLAINNSNAGCGSSTVSHTITIPGRPKVNLGADTSLCNPGSSILLDATSWPGSIYQWQDFSAGNTYNVNAAGSGTYYVSVEYNGCTRYDTIQVNINPITPYVYDYTLCGNDSVFLNANHGYGETYLWNTGSTDYYIYALIPGNYINTISWNSCTMVDSFHVFGIIRPFTIHDTTVCTPFATFVLDGTVPTGQSYYWQDGTPGPGYTISTPGLYWLNVNYGGCSIQDTIVVNEAAPPLVTNISAFICSGQNYTLPWGTVVNTSGVYSNTIQNMSGCDSLTKNVTLTVNSLAGTTTDASICNSQLPYTWNAQTYNSGGTYQLTLTGTGGCDSIVTLNLVVNNASGSSTDITICNSQLPYSWNGNIYPAAGSFAVTLTGSAGCDSIATLNLFVNNITSSTTDVIICDNLLPYSWNGNSYPSAGTYAVTLTAGSGCDSIATLNLLVNPGTASTTDLTICNNQLPYTWNGNTYATAGTYAITLSNSNGCDSIATLNLTVNPATTSSTDVAICNAQLPFAWNGNSYSLTGSYTVTLINSNGCDSLATLNLVVNAATSSTTDIAICSSQLPYSWNGNTYPVAGTYSVTIVNSNGCDSVATLYLTANAAVTSSTDVAICNSQLPYTWNGNSFPSGGTYTVTLISNAGCDSIATLNLTVNPAVSSITDIAICNTLLPYGWNGNNYPAGGSYSVTLVNSNGCDSVATLNLVVNLATTSTTDISICSSQLPYSWNGNSYPSGGTYSVTLVNNNSCDSIAILNLTANNTTASTTDVTICNTLLPYNWNGNSYPTAGTYAVTLISSAGCDSIATLNLVVNGVATSTTDIVVCNSQLPYTWNGNSYPTGGTYSVTLVSSAGCDSIATLNLTVTATITSITAITICNSQLPYTWNGNSYPIAGTYSVTLVSSAGCDSIATLNLTVNLSTTSTTSIAICNAQLPYNWNGNSYPTGGTYSITLIGSSGCDSVATLNLTVNPITTSATNINICSSQLPYTWNGNTYPTGGTYTITLVNSAGCDSIATLNLTANTTITTTTGITICNTQLPYTWNGNSYPVGGTYAVTFISSAGCDSIATLNLNVATAVASTTDLAICSSQLPYTWNGNSYTVGGTYSVILVSSAGCDSVATLNLTVATAVTSTTAIAICSTQLPYNWNGNSYTGAGTYSVTLISSAGCDSIATLNLTVNVSLTSVTNIAICNTQLPYLWNGNSYPASGTYSVTLIGSSGCDSIATLNLTTNPVAISTTNINICNSQLPYTWNGNNYPVSGTYTVTLMSSAGCDSIATLNLTASSIITTTTTIAVCNTQLPYSWNGNSYAAAGTYSVTLISSAGCDSIAALSLVVNATVTSNTNINICNSQLPYSWNGNSYPIGGTYSEVLVSSAGCDSVATLNLTANAVVTSSTALVICNTQLPYSWNGNSYPAGGTYSVTLTSNGGCDSIATLNLTVNAILTSNTPITICNDQLPYNWNGNTYATAGIYSVTLASSSGCDSVATLNLTVNLVTTSTTSFTTCNNQLPYTWNGNNYSAQGTYQVTLTNSSGCDSIATLNLTVNTTTTGSIAVSICNNQLPYSWNGNSYPVAGTYQVTLTNSHGCDSVSTLILTVNSLSTSTSSISICSAQLPYSWNGQVYSNGGAHIVTLINAAGCDSIATLNLTVNAITTSNSNATTCSNQLPYSWNGQNYSTGGTYTVTLINAAGCDSLATLNLTVNPVVTSTTNSSICSAQLPYNWNGNNYPSAGSYQVTLVSSAGCDSIATLNLTVNLTPLAPVVSSPATYCQHETTTALTASTGTTGGTLLWYTTATGGTGSSMPPVPSSSTPGVTNYYVSEMNGLCEGPRSLIIVTVNNSPDLGPDQGAKICFGQSFNLQSLFNTNAATSSWTFNQATVTDPGAVTIAGQYELIASNTNGCADTAFVNLIVKPQIIANAGNDANAEYNIPYQLSGSGGGQYQWTPSSVLNNAFIANPLAVLTEDQTFILMVKDDFGCFSLDTVKIRVLKGPTFYVPTAFTPNGDGLNDIFRPTAVGIRSLEYFRIFNRYGELVFETHDLGKGWDGTYKGVKQNLGNYIWMIKGVDRFGKERSMKGNVVLIR
ncbi:MAG: gliding motility-associated C-terminal domain-containing protein [Ferruginibacter sp.]